MAATLGKTNRAKPSPQRGGSNRSTSLVSVVPLGLNIIAGFHTQGSAEARFTPLVSPWAFTVFPVET